MSLECIPQVDSLPFSECIPRLDQRHCFASARGGQLALQTLDPSALPGINPVLSLIPGLQSACPALVPVPIWGLVPVSLVLDWRSPGSSFRFCLRLLSQSEARPLRLNWPSQARGNPRPFLVGLCCLLTGHHLLFNLPWLPTTHTHKINILITGLNMQDLWSL